MVVSEVVSEQVTQRSPLEVWWYGSECVFVGMKTGKGGEGRRVRPRKSGEEIGGGGGRSRPPQGAEGEKGRALPKQAKSRRIHNPRRCTLVRARGNTPESFRGSSQRKYRTRVAEQLTRSST